jgi:hypothetical protein
LRALRVVTTDGRPTTAQVLSAQALQRSARVPLSPPLLRLTLGETTIGAALTRPKLILTLGKFTTLTGLSKDIAPTTVIPDGMITRR